MTRAKTQRPKTNVPTKRAATQSRKKPQAEVVDDEDEDDDEPYDQMVAELADELDPSDAPAERSSTRQETLQREPAQEREVTVPAKRVPPTPPPGSPARSTAERAAEAAPKPKVPFPERGRPPDPRREAERPAQPARSLSPPRSATPAPEPVALSEPPAPRAGTPRPARQDSPTIPAEQRAESPVVHRRALSVGETAAEDLVVETEELPEIQTLSIAVHDAPPAVSAAQRVIFDARHTVAVAGAGPGGIEKVAETIRSGTVDVLIVGIPGGEALIDCALALAPRRPVVIAACTGDVNDAVRRAAASGADLVTIRPHEAERLAPALLAASRLVDERHSATNARGSETILRARLDALVEPEPGALQPFELFQRVLELELKRARRYLYPIAVALFAVDIAPPEPPPGVRGILRARAGNALIHAIRDIDLATEVDHERFLVLLPYTDLGGAAEVARRIIGAVADHDPVVAAGRSFPPRIIGSVASGAPGQPLSFARLMRDATKALEQARRDGAELAVPM